MTDSASDVTALVLSLGEDTTGRAIASVNAQTHPVVDVVLVKNVSPFHRALNQGVALVRTPYFVQVDADMVLDKDCVAALFDCMEDGVGIAVGGLRDPLSGRVIGVKLFRTLCFQHGGFPDSVSPDTDFVEAIGRAGWVTVYALRFMTGAREDRHTFGEHRPCYSANYTYSKFLLEGRRYRYRRQFRALIGHLDSLAQSRHDLALLAQVAIAQCIFLESTADQLVPYSETPDGQGIQAFLADARSFLEDPEDIPQRFPAWLPPAVIFFGYYGVGSKLRQKGGGREFASLIGRLAKIPTDWARIARIAVCHGLCQGRFGSFRASQRDWAMLAEFLPPLDAGWPWLRRRLTRCLLALAKTLRVP
jgi:hypothetical protein